MLSTGKVIRFDEFKGYGFVAPDEGGEDVFIHVNDLDFDKRLLAPGVRVEYVAVDGDRGLKATQVQIIDGPASTALVTRHKPDVPYHHTVPVTDHQNLEDVICDVLSEADFTAEVTEALLTSNGTVTAAQILDIRSAMLRVAHDHKWIEN
ncbi:cold-shock protein [Rhodococcus sp. 15-725-2-2b]|jgi:cold shock CspA family protein|uniref:cold-shock protein n=1 Tax=unclassified Rhodococcus (in: high G+C Gram-positive bacteria) TaxID=192944 RepID=UPI000B9B313E|nr:MULTISPECIES: cold shock domain-containing protein [unclassified Rhodococcus (in: high G+C Gram-positive bacteria)]OZC55938.1 cold-shock protein [Rhodococcus sp. 06-470-2]OZC65084.1 cold-shock protein [Rhodococcus sp. 06-469-3-2]OZC80261.1 cold-shock protein [Rhodococcus sp. 06-418-5]OZD46692.1 cold-shock protein [Rhodococcus sp. 06-1477-1A]OZE04167.1 cold-shock protein [Rhodococcus sp. 05-2255-3C]